MAAGAAHKPRTREGYEHLLGCYLRPVLGPMAIDMVTPSVVRTWWSRLPADKPTVRARSYALLKAVMNTAGADELIDSSPCRIRGAANTPRAPEVRPATSEELEVIVLLCAWCALRSGEVLELRRRDADVAAGTVRVVRAWSWVGGEPIVGTPKSAAGTRVVSIPPHVMPAIAHLPELQGGSVTAASTPPSGTSRPRMNRPLNAAEVCRVPGDAGRLRQGGSAVLNWPWLTTPGPTRRRAPRSRGPHLLRDLFYPTVSDRC